MISRTSMFARSFFILSSLFISFNSALLSSASSRSILWRQWSNNFWYPLLSSRLLLESNTSLVLDTLNAWSCWLKGNVWHNIVFFFDKVIWCFVCSFHLNMMSLYILEWHLFFNCWILRSWVNLRWILFVNRCAVFAMVRRMTSVWLSINCSDNAVMVSLKLGLAARMVNRCCNKVSSSFHSIASDNNRSDVRGSIVPSCSAMVLRNSFCNWCSFRLSRSCTWQ